MKGSHIMKDFTLAGETASRIAQGCMRISGLDEKQVDTLIHTDLDCGINFFDHANIYGGNGLCEAKFGAFLRANPGIRDRMLIQTKCAIHDGIYDFSKEHILTSTEESLKRLDIDTIDFLLLHRPDTLCEPEEVAEAFELLHAQGKVRYFGVSNHNPMQMQLLARYLKEKLVINQLQFSITNTTMIDAGLNVNMENVGAVCRDGYVLDYCRLNDITIQPWSPLQFGFFGGTFLGNPDYARLNQALQDMASRYGITDTGLAIAWILRHPAVMQPVIGTVNPGRIREICDASNVTITRSEWYELYRATGKQLP